MIASVDFKALAKSVVDFTTFLIQNGEAIAKTIAVIFAISTAYKAMAVATGIATLATDLYKYAVAKAAAGSAIATVAVKGLSLAMRLIPFVAVVAGLALLVTAFTNTTKWAGKTESGVAAFADKLQYAGGKAAVLVKNLDAIPKNINTTITISAGYDNAETKRLTEQAFGRGSLDMSLGKFDETTTETTTGGGAKTKQPSLADQLAKDATIVKKQTKLVAAGVSEGLAARITSGSAPIKRANKVLTSITKNNGKLTKRLKRMERNLKVANQETVAVIEDTSVADALAQKERVYASFADSVKNTFAGIKNSIMGAFDITQLGGSTDSITRNMDKMLVKLRAFSNNVKSLASMGLNSALLQQVISAGPMAGAQLAANLVAGGAGALSAINAGYTEFGSLSSQIAQTGTEALFGSQAQQSIYNISVNGGVGSGATIGAAIVDAIKAYERTSGAVWQGA